MTVAVAVVVKAPVAGCVKTRMQPALSAHQAAELAVAMLEDVTAAAVATEADVWWSYAGSRAVLDRLRPDGVRMLMQMGDGLGSRLAHTHRTLHRAGYGRVVLVGADCPTIDGPSLCEAIALLDDHDVVLGPATDGGYTMLGSGTCAPSLFSAVPMSTAHTSADTLRQARRLGLDVVMTTARPDLDTVADLRAALVEGWLLEAPQTRRFAERAIATVRLPMPREPRST